LEAIALARKLRVYELAKHYGVDSPTIMKMMRDMHAEAKSHMSVVEDDIIERIHSTYQRKREQMRLNYAKAHNMDPEKLKHVASFKPLDMPQPPEDPEADKKAAKKKAAKKKTAKKKTAKKTTKKKTTKKAAAKKKAEEPVEPETPETVDAPDAAAEASETPPAEAETEAKPEKRPIRRARIVRRAPVPEAEPEETPAEAVEAPAETAEPVEPVEAPSESGAPDEAVVETEPPAEAAAPAETAEETAEAEEAPVAEAEKTAETPAEPEAPTVEKPAEPADPVNRRPRRQARIIRMGEGEVRTSTGKQVAADRRPPQRAGGAPGQEQPNWNWDQVRGDLTGGRPRPRVGSEMKDSVRESVQQAMQRRAEMRVQSPAAPGRKRRKKKKVDDAAVAASVKATLAQIDGAGGKRKRRKGGEDDGEDVVMDVLHVTEFITVQELAEKFEVPAREIIGKLFALGAMVTINQRLEKDQVELLAEEFEKEINFMSEFGEEELAEAEPEIAEEDLEDRAPVVTVMGHVDHGKTSLLDYIRATNVIAGEAGGITQHVAAYRVETPGGPITFLDTPGHEAFSAMRARGAQVTDIVILVVAADDQIMPQTIEAINHAKAAGVPIIVAINKCDLPAARPDLVKQGLLQHEILVEEFGGDVLCAEISAKKGDNVDKLLEQVHLQSEVLELKATSKGLARGVVVEASKDPGRGVVFTVLVEQGTLKIGENFLVGMQDGKVRALLNERGEALDSVGPGEPAVILGAHDVPIAGDRLHVLESEREARDIASRRRHMQRIQQFSAPKKTISLENLAEFVADSDVKELPIIVKADVSGSLEAICDSLMKLNTEEVQVRVVHKGVGAVNESDVLLAGNTGALIVGFHMRPGAAILEKAAAANISIETFDIIYEVVDTMKKAMAGLLGTITREVSTGSAEIRQVFRIPKVGTIAGAYVTNGTIIRNSLVRLVRDEVMIFEGRISSLKRFKEDAKEVQSGYECGLGLENFHDLKEGDIVETYRIEEEVRTEL
jgi:translation initiation factor IF-2